MIEVINTYEGREFGVRQGNVKQIFRKIYRCTKCGETFESKEEGTHHATEKHTIGNSNARRTEGDSKL